MKFIYKIRNIIRGWIFKVLGKNEKLAKKRIAVCNKCNSRERIDIVGDICGECGCVLEAKARVLDERCKLNKW